MDVVRSQRIDSHRRHDGAVDAAGEAQNHVLEAVLVDIVTQPQHTGPPWRFIDRGKISDHAVDAAPAIVGVMPVRDDEVGLEALALQHQLVAGLHGEGRAVVDQFVLAADLVQVEHGDVVFPHPVLDQALAGVLLVAPVGRTVGTEQDARAVVDQVLADLGVPDVLADRHADRDNLDGERLGQRPGGEIALFEEHVVIGELALEARSDHFPVLGQQHGIVQGVALPPDRRQQQADSGAAGRLRKGVRSLDGIGDELRLEQQVLREVPGQEQLGQQQDVCLRGNCLGQRLAAEFQIGGQRPDLGVELRQRDAKSIGHLGSRKCGARLSPSPLEGQATSQSQSEAMRTGRAGRCARISSATRKASSSAWLALSRGSQ